jgi:DNA-binding response OmpR family regulator
MMISPGHHVLLIEDDEAIRELISDVLRAEGSAVTTATDGAAAIRLLDQYSPDDNFCVILLDWMLPGLNGLAVLRELQARGTSVPVIAMSASRDDLQQAIRAGAHVALAKPFEVEHLLGLLAKHCARDHG